MTTTVMKQTEIDWPAHLRGYAAKYEAIAGDGDALLQEMGRLLGVMAEHWSRLAVVYRLAEAAGADLGRFRRAYPTLVPTLRRVAGGQVLPELAEKFALKGSDEIRSLVYSLPLDEQRRLASDEPLKVLQMSDDGQVTHRLIAPTALDVRQARQVFDRSGRIRDEAEQRSIVERRMEESRRRRPPAGPYVIDKRRKVVRFTEPCELDLGELSELLGRLRGGS